jgi:peptidoglycan-associated lipoprotein
MKKILVLLSAIVCFPLVYTQTEKYFELTDTYFEKNMICIKEIQFTFDACMYFPEYQSLIDSIGTFLKKNPSLIVEIGLHTDFRGSDEYNIKLTECRANRVTDNLISQGISKERIIPKGYGESKPRYLEKDYKKSGCGCIFPKGTTLSEEYFTGLDTKTTEGLKKFEDAHQLNRRMEIKILEVN